MKVKFDYLSNQGNVIMAKRWFEQMLKVKLNKRQFSDIELLKNLTPGDFKAVSYKYAFQSQLNADDLIAELSSEVSYKKIRQGISL